MRLISDLLYLVCLNRARTPRSRGCVRLRDLRPRLGEGATQVRTQSDEWQPATAVAQRHHHRHLRATPEVLPRLLVGARGDEHLVNTLLSARGAWLDGHVLIAHDT